MTFSFLTHLFLVFDPYVDPMEVPLCLKIIFMLKNSITFQPQKKLVKS